MILIVGRSISPQVEEPLSFLVKVRNIVWVIFLEVVRLILVVKAAFERAVIPRVNPPIPQGSVSEEALLSRFAGYLTPSGAGVECGAGWYRLLWDLCAAIEGLEQLGMPRGTTVRAESKLGGLIVQASSKSLIVKELALRVEQRATEFCEDCGAPGELRIGRGFVRTLCDEHARIRRIPPKNPHPAPLGAPPELIFIDTEFTDFDYPQLISIGLVSERGERFYAELSNGWSKEACSIFVRQSVLPQLLGGDFLQERYYAGRRLCGWIEGHGGPVRLVCDAPGYDWFLLMDLLAEFRPENLIWAPLGFYSPGFAELIPKLQKAREEALKKSSPHHALNDAEALRSAWRVMVENVPPAVLERYLQNC